MDLTDEILEQAMMQFDSSGVVAVEDGTVLMLGLAHTQERNLDEGVFEGGRFRQTGWPKHMKPRMTALMDVIKDKGFEAEPVGWWGYGDDILRLKRLAVTAGMGQQGKNSLFLDPKVGPQIRLAAMRTNAPLTATGPGVYERKEHPLCQSCSICIEACPVEGLLEPYRLLDPLRCLSNMENPLVRDGRERLGGCHEPCRTACPVGK